MPYFKCENELDFSHREYFNFSTADLKLVFDYTGFNFSQCMELDCVTYKILLRDAYISKLEETEEGMEFLNTYYASNQEEPDIEKLKNLFINS